MLSFRTRVVLGATAFTVFIGAAAASWVIFGNSPPHASAEAAACREKPRELNNLQPAASAGLPPGAVLLGDGAGEIPLARYAGKGILLNFWATWCAPCIRELPGLNKLAAGGETFVVPPAQRC